WLFGDERRGWRHRYLFNAEELAQLAVQAGFVAVTATPVGENPERPSLLLRATRAPDTPGVDFAIRFHGLLLARGVVDPDDAPAYLAAVETICTDVLPLLTTPGEASLLQLFSMAARYSPEVAACALAALPERGRWPAEMLATADALVATLQATHFTARLACRWRTLAPASFQTRAPWATLEREISLYLAACLYPNEGLDDIRGTFERVTGRRHPADARLRIFTREALAELARDLTAEGVRVFAHGRLDVARDAFETALSYDAGLLWPRWNLARICRVQGRVLEALEHYEALQHDLPVIFRPAYEQELDALSDRAAPPPGSDGPLVDPRDLVEAGS
ncbi:MAG: hypothetical protein JXB35_14935, partial [Anaerolineae bacterium]|nr:hypothetical protein [Anaerolineae bacterium]